MQRQRIACFAVLVIVSLFTACANTETALPEPEPQSTVEDTKSDMEEAEKLYFDVLRDPASAAILTVSWSSPDEIDPNFFIYFFGNRSQLSRLSTDMDPFPVPAYIVESLVQAYFEVETQHLRSSRFYNAETEEYLLPIMSGGPLSFRLTDVEEDGMYRTLSYAYYFADHEIARAGRLRVRKLDEYDTGMNQYQYVSCSVKNFV